MNETTSEAGNQINPESASLWQRLVMGRRPKTTLIRGSILAVVSVIVCKFLFLPMWVEGESMAPTYHTGTFNFVNTLAYRNHPPQRGDVVAIRLPRTRAMLMKRIIGLPGERFEIRRGQVYINGKPLDEPYLKFNSRQRPWGERPLKLMPNEYYIIGDNRGMHQTNHAHGVVRRERIVGKVAF